MTVEQFKKILRARPFEQFDFYLADGRVFHVDHPENAVLSDAGRTFELFANDESREIFDMLMVVSLKPATAPK